MDRRQTCDALLQVDHHQCAGLVEFCECHVFYLACFSANRTLIRMLIAAIPPKKTISEESSPLETFPTRKSMYPATRLHSAQTTFTGGGDNPFPGGCASGYGNRSPEMPCTK